MISHEPRTGGWLGWLVSGVFLFSFTFALSNWGQAAPHSAINCAQQPCYTYYGWYDTNRNNWSNSCTNGDANCIKASAKANWWTPNNAGGTPRKTGANYDQYLWTMGALDCSNLDANNNPVAPQSLYAPLGSAQLINANQTQYGCN